MLTYSPLPSWRGIAGSLVPVTRGNDLSTPWRRPSETAGWLSRSAWSLALIAQWRMAAAPGKAVTIWIPDFFCNASLLPLRHTGAKIVFYPINAGMDADMEACRVLAEAEKPDVFVLVHFFGKPAESAPARDFCARNGAWLVEDGAQVLRPGDGIGSFGDFILYSPHKLLPLPDGAVLIARHHGPSKLKAETVEAFGNADSWASQLGPLDRKLRASGAIVDASPRGWFGKRVLQRLGVGGGARSTAQFDEDAGAETRSPQALAPPEQSALSRRLLSGLVGSLDQVARERERNQLLWDVLLAESGVNVSPAARPKSREWTPYVASYRVDGESGRSVYQQLRRAGIPVTTWPDIAPEIAAARNQRTDAWKLRHTMVYLPVHQTLGRSQFDRVRLTMPPRSRGRASVTIEWNRVTREAWSELLTRSGRSNLLQSWAYGEAKRETAGWRVRRGVAKADGRPIAIVQVLQKRIGPVLLSRVNRGPLFLDGANANEQFEVWRQVAALGKAGRLRILSIAPELGVNGHSLELVEELGLGKRRSLGYESSWLDLQASEGELRRRLDGKWRNMLTASEKSGLVIDANSDDEAFAWLIAQYRELMLEKGFAGTPIEVIESIRKHERGDERLVVFRALLDGLPQAGICIAAHGVAATYLIGRNGLEGRRLKANQFLLWQAILALRERGLLWFDLGGFSERDTPGVMTFKLGLNGERYELLGEYLKW